MLITVSKILSAVIVPQSHSSCQVLYGFWVQFKIYSNEQIFQKLTKFGWSSEIFWNRWKDLLGGCQRYSKMLGWSLLIFGRAVEISEDFTGRKKRKLQILKPHKRLKVHLLGIYFSRLKARILVEMMVNQYFYYHCVVHVIHWKGLCAKMNKKTACRIYNGTCNTINVYSYYWDRAGKYTLKSSCPVGQYISVFSRTH